DRLGAGRRRAAIIAVPPPMHRAMMHGHFAALVVAAVDAASPHLGDGLPRPAGLHDRPLFAHGDLDARAAAFRAHLADALVSRASALGHYRHTLAPIRCVIFRAALLTIDDARGLVRLGDALVDVDGAHRRGARGRATAAVVGPCGANDRGQD